MGKWDGKEEKEKREDMNEKDLGIPRKKTGKEEKMKRKSEIVWYKEGNGEMKEVEDKARDEW